MRSIFECLDEKRKGSDSLENFSKIFEKFRKYFEKSFKKVLDISKNVYFSIFCKVLLKPCVQFSRVWTKNTNCWENFKKILKILEEKSIEKMIFLLFLEKVLLKIEPWKITPDFYNNFFRISGGGTFPCSPPPFQALKV